MQKNLFYKIFAIGLFISIGYATTPYAIAQSTPVDKQVLLAQLLAQVASLQQQFANISVSSALTNPVPVDISGQTNSSNQNYSSCNIVRTLARGARGQDVICLQQYLINRGLLSEDSATGYFGALTEAAVQKFQAANQIVSSGNPQTTGYGSVGARTRAALFTVTSYTTPSYTEQPGTTQSYAMCNFSGSSMSHGVSVTAYQYPTAVPGSSCVSEIRSCNNGVLSGSYQYSSCSATEALSCNLDGVTIPHNADYTFYAASTVPYGKYCDSQEYGAQTRTCSNGVLSGSSRYNKVKCTVSIRP